MALTVPTQSPAVVVREIDLTGGVPNVQSTTGALVGNFSWGPARERVQIANENELVATFGSPNTTNNVDFLSAAQFLRYSSSLQVVREVDGSATTAFALQNNTFSNLAITDSASLTSVGLSDSAAAQLVSGGQTPNDIADLTNPVILNDDNFDARESSISAISKVYYTANGNIDSASYGTLKIGYASRFLGSLGNSIKVETVGLLRDSAGFNTVYDTWTYASEFERRPDTSVTATAAGSTNDEIHVIVVDSDGLISGTKGTVLEKFANVSILSDAKNEQGLSVFAKDVINETSEYVKLVNFDSDLGAKGAGGVTSLNTNYALTDLGAAVALNNHKFTHLFSRGANSGSLTTTEFGTGFDLFEDKDQVEVDFLIAPGMSDRTSQTTVVNDIVGTAQSTRKDCVVVTSPARSDLVGVTSDATKVTNTVATADTFTKSSYLVMDNNYLKVYDKFNDKYVEIPAASTIAGIMAATDINRAAWFSPAGARRGQMLGITALNYSPTKGQRDTLYKNGINPIANIPGQGSLLFGDKTFLGRVSAFDRINVRRLFLILERAIGRAAEQVLFELNDEFTRAEFVNIVEPVLREVQGRRGITDFRVVCDETNNTAAVVDRNEFKADIFIKPARSINFVTLSFVAVRTGVDFEEVVGTV